MPGPLEGRTALVTGSTRGIGKAIALQFARDGGDVVICGRSEVRGTDNLPGTILETVSEIEKTGRRALGVRVDLGEERDLVNLVNRSIESFGKIDVLVNNAVIVDRRRRLFGGDADWLDTSYRVNIRAPFRLMQMVGANMAERGGGTIINISSRGAMNPPPPSGPSAQVDSMDPAYPVSKAAMDRMTTAYAAELWASNICILALRPGLVITERIEQAAVRPNVDKSRAEPVDYIARAASLLAQSGMTYAGQILQAKQFLESKNALPV